MRKTIIEGPRKEPMKISDAVQNKKFTTISFLNPSRELSMLFKKVLVDVGLS